MTKTNKYLVPILLFVSLILLSKADADTINVGYFVLKPHAMEGHKGVAVEYFKFISQKMRISEIRFRLVPLKRALAELEGEK